MIQHPYKCTYTNANNRAYVSIYTSNLWDLNDGSKYIITPINEFDHQWLRVYMVVKYETQYRSSLPEYDVYVEYSGCCDICYKTTDRAYFYVEHPHAICCKCIKKYNKSRRNTYMIDKYDVLCGWMLKNNDAGYLAVKGMQGYLLRELSPAKYIRCLKYKKLNISNNYHQYSKCIYCDNKLKKARIESHSLCEDCDAFLHDYCISIANKTYWLIDHLCEDNVSDIRLILISITLLKDY